MDFSSLSTEELDLFIGVVTDSSQNWLRATNVVDEEKNKLRGFLSRFETAAEDRPFVLVKEDVAFAAQRLETALTFGYDENTMTVTEGEGLSDAIKFAMAHMAGDGIESVLKIHTKVRIVESFYMATVPMGPADRLAAPCTITIACPKVARNTLAIGDNGLSIYLNAHGMGMLYVGESITFTTNVSVNALSPVGFAAVKTRQEPTVFYAMPGLELRFVVQFDLSAGLFYVGLAGDMEG
jgi:hypothetical protein